MAESFRKGDKGEWSSHGGTAVGRVEEKITSRTTPRRSRPANWGHDPLKG